MDLQLLSCATFMMVQNIRVPDILFRILTSRPKAGGPRSRRRRRRNVVVPRTDNNDNNIVVGLHREHNTMCVYIALYGHYNYINVTSVSGSAAQSGRKPDNTRGEHAFSENLWLR